jgi:2-polyprenyl-3-methyl-5-hydroxy-6-metoxy-1,4-benzoquinol methylase
MIDYLIVIYKNYDLLELQLENFERRFKKEDYRLVVIDNTPDGEKKNIPLPEHVSFIPIPSTPTFDGISHGHAINEGLKYCTSPIVGIIDSDFFIMDENIHRYVINKFNDGYKAVGCEFNDGKDTKQWVQKSPENFENIPCCYGAYYDLELARSNSWIITQDEVNANAATGFIEVGYRIRQHILNNKIKTLSWKTQSNQYGNCFFENEDNEVVGLHYVAGSHRRWNEKSKDEIRGMIHSTYKPLNNCLCCNSDKLELVLDLNTQPLANSYLKSPVEKEYSYPLGINYCDECTHIQLTHVVDPDLLFKNYLYVSGTSQTLKDYFNWFVDFTGKYTEGKKILDIACNDGTQLDAYKVKGYDTYGIDPAENLYELSSKNHNVIRDYFISASQFDTKFDIITAQNVFAHNSYPLKFLESCKGALNKDGCIFIQTSQADMVKNNQFDTIYHEHISFFSVKSFCTLAHRAGLNVIDVIRTPIHGISFVFVLSKDAPDRSDEFIAMEEQLSYRKMFQYAGKCKNIADDMRSMISNLKQQGYKIIGYGAAAKGNTFLNFAKFKLDYIVDDNPLKHNLFSPGTRIPILPTDTLFSEEGEICVVPLAWNFFDEIKSKVLSRKSDKINFLKYFPEVVCTKL